MERIRSLDQVLSYRHDGLVRLFSEKKRIALDESAFLFTETKKLLWFMAQRSADAGPFVIFSEQGIIDEYWHEFILITKDYHAFCDFYFGRYIHHTPQLANADSPATTDSKAYIADKHSSLRRTMTEVAAVLGAETVIVWYHDLPRKYFYPSHNAGKAW